MLKINLKLKYLSAYGLKPAQPLGGRGCSLITIFAVQLLFWKQECTPFSMCFSLLDYKYHYTCRVSWGDCQCIVLVKATHLLGHVPKLIM